MCTSAIALVVAFVVFFVCRAGTVLHFVESILCRKEALDRPYVALMCPIAPCSANGAEAMAK